MVSALAISASGLAQAQIFHEKETRECLHILLIQPIIEAAMASVSSAFLCVLTSLLGLSATGLIGTTMLPPWLQASIMRLRSAGVDAHGDSLLSSGPRQAAGGAPVEAIYSWFNLQRPSPCAACVKRSS